MPKLTPEQIKKLPEFDPSNIDHVTAFEVFTNTGDWPVSTDVRDRHENSYWIAAIQSKLASVAVHLTLRNIAITEDVRQLGDRARQAEKKVQILTTSLNSALEAERNNADRADALASSVDRLTEERDRCKAQHQVYVDQIERIERVGAEQAEKIQELRDKVAELDEEKAFLQAGTETLTKSLKEKESLIRKMTGKEKTK